MPLTTEQLSTLAGAIRRRLDSLAAELRRDAGRERDESYGALAGPVTDSGDEASADVLADLAHAELSRDLGELRELEAALARLAAGAYGTCPDCGDDIAFERLAAHPAALRCAGCQGASEKMRTRAPRL